MLFLAVVFGLLLGCLVACLVVLIVPLRYRWDRKVQWERGRTSPVWTGLAAMVSEAFVVSPDAAISLAGEAIKAVGGKDVSVVNDMVTGWTGSMWTNFPPWQAYQLVIEVRHHAGDEHEFVCGARPRKMWSLSQLGTRRVGRNLAQDLAAEVRRMNAPS